MPTYEYVKKDGTLATTDDQANAPDIDPRSGFATINSASLSQTGTPKITQPLPSTQMTGLGAAIETQSAQTQADAAAKAESDRMAADVAAKQQTSQTSLKDYLKGLTGSKGEVALTDEAYRKEVDPYEADLKDINQQIFQEQQSLRRRLEALQKNPQGLFGGGLEAEMRRVENESIAKQADLSVIQLARQGKYDSAKAIADRAVQAKLEQQRNNLEALRVNYEENKDLFTTAEQRQFETMQADRERALNKQDADAKTLSDTKLAMLQSAASQGAPTAILTAIQNAQTPEQALTAAGQYAGDILEREALRANIAQSIAATAASNRANRPGAEAPTVQTINGIDMQWNPSTGQWDAIGSPAQTKAQLQNNEALTLAKELRKDTAEGKKSAVGASLAKLVPFGQASGLQPGRTAFEARVETLKSNLTLDNLKLLKGAMSDKDLLFLNSIGSSLNTGMSEKSFNQELDRVIAKLEGAGATSAPTEGQTKVWQGTTYVVRGGNWVPQ